ncbi:MAG: hypothetical protein M3209_08595 [Acidobacteriota bacterium]|nr:hypothetical protein [Acidobacteriota bacterium]
MNSKPNTIVLLIILNCLLFFTAQAQTTALTYQGRLTELNAPANGTFDLQFKLYDALTGGNQIGVAIEKIGTNVSNGIFTVKLNESGQFGASAFPGADRYLEISVRKNSTQSYTTLPERQQITASPYAIRTISASFADQLSSSCVGCVQNSHINSVSAGKLTGTLAPTQGGTGLSSVSTGSLLYGSGTNIFSLLEPVSPGNVLLSGTLPTWGKIDLTAQGNYVTGILPAANGGTGANDVQFSKSGSTVRTFTLPDVSDTLAVTNTAQTWGAAQYFFQGISLNALSRTGNYIMSSTDSVIYMSPDAATQWVELPCAVTVGAGRLAVVKKMNTLYSIYIAGCFPGTEKIDNANTVTLPAVYRGSVILMSRGTSNGWVIIGSHGLAED